jgi:hypothetical protein
VLTYSTCASDEATNPAAMRMRIVFTRHRACVNKRSISPPIPLPWARTSIHSGMLLESVLDLSFSSSFHLLLPLISSPITAPALACCQVRPMPQLSEHRSRNYLLELPDLAQYICTLRIFSQQIKCLIHIQKM